MGLCASSVASSVHETYYGNDDNVIVIENNFNDASIDSQQGSDGVNQDSAILYQNLTANE
ncbi:hypothetical protein Leryth_004960 [Lithospermum erythrorhizon]|nr:hypothetical protein Leryth_004960 [Lithospermum erythrorhizon]